MAGSQLDVEQTTINFVDMYDKIYTNRRLVIQTIYKWERSISVNSKN
jgi:hypothetical protein